MEMHRVQLKVYSFLFASSTHNTFNHSRHMIGAHLGLHRFQPYRSANKRKPDATAKLAKGVSGEQAVEWAHGSSVADSQNFARVLMEVTIADLLHVPTVQFSMFNLHSQLTDSS